MNGKGKNDFFSTWNPESDVIGRVLSNRINYLKEQIETLEIEQMTMSNESGAYRNQKAIALARSEIGSLSGILEVYLSEMEDRKKAWIEQRQKKQVQLTEKVAILLQYKQIIANTQIPEINASLRAGTNGAIVCFSHSAWLKQKKLNGQELTLLNSLNEIINPTIYSYEKKRAYCKKLQISVEQGMRIAIDSPVRIVGHNTGSEIKCLLDRVASCKLFSSMPSWLQNAIFIQQMSATAPTRAATNSSCFIIGGDSDCSSTSESRDDQTEKS
ncbi:hypothetical protein ACH3XW_4550 [Acanthocheilonema viteae]